MTVVVSAKHLVSTAQYLTRCLVVVGNFVSILQVRLMRGRKVR